MKKSILSFLFITIGLISSQLKAADLIFKHGFENDALVAGVVTGLSSTGLVLQLSVGASVENLSLDANGVFTFYQSVAVGSLWSISVLTQPSNPTAQICTLSNASGTMVASGVNNVQVTCSNSNDWDVMNWNQGSWN
ncbi:MAG: hypothetical protein L3J83_03005 [Proteobacteria bacterium]|nr:hypothetical protein [Pseudomonadota bacterium]